MTQFTRALVACGLLFLGAAAPGRGGEQGAFEGEWRTSIGTVKLKQTRSAVRRADRIRRRRWTAIATFST